MQLQPERGHVTKLGTENKLKMAAAAILNFV